MFDLMSFCAEHHTKPSLRRPWLAPNDWLGAVSPVRMVMAHPDRCAGVRGLELPHPDMAQVIEGTIETWRKLTGSKAHSVPVADLLGWLGAAPLIKYGDRPYDEDDDEDDDDREELRVVRLGGGRAQRRPGAPAPGAGR